MPLLLPNLPLEQNLYVDGVLVAFALFMITVFSVWAANRAKR